MSDVTTEQKLQLIQQVRSRYNRNQYDLSNRERIIYGKSFSKMPYDESAYNASDTKPMPSSFKLRFMLALLLGAAVIFMDRNDIKIAGITSDKIYQAISADFEENIEKMVAAMTKESMADNTITDDR